MLSMLQSLFQTSNVFLRELVQNALEATFQATRIGVSPEPISVTTMYSPGQGGSVQVTDSGIGMTADELALNLNRLFYSGWPKGDSLGIGQFGFGFYTTFLAGHTVTVTSRSRRDPAAAYTWTLARNDSVAHIEPISGPLPPLGTTIEVLMAEADCVDTEMVLDILREQYLYVPYPISVDGIALGLPRREGWAKSISGRGSSAQETFADRYGWSDSPLLVWPLTGTATGSIAVVPEEVTAPPFAIYRRGVKVTDSEILAPPLSMIICGVVDVDSISLKPDRETLREDEDLHTLHKLLHTQSVAMLTDCAARRTSTLDRILAAHGPFLVRAMLRDEDLRKAVGRHLSLPLYFEDHGNTRARATIEELLQRSTIISWSSDRRNDQLFADRAQRLGRMPVFLSDPELIRLVTLICADVGVALRHVAISYLDEARHTATHDAALTRLFSSTLGDGWAVVCTDDVDARVPLRIVATSPGTRAVPAGITSGETFDRFLRAMLHNRPDGDSFLRGLKTKEPARVAIVNTSNDLIRDLRAELAAPSHTPAALQRYAQIIMTLARFMSNATIDADEFAALNGEVLAILQTHLRDHGTRPAEGQASDARADVRDPHGVEGGYDNGISG
jgi:hypothetical protein